MFGSILFEVEEISALAPDHCSNYLIKMLIRHFSTESTVQCGLRPSLVSITKGRRLVTPGGRSSLLQLRRVYLDLFLFYFV